MAELAPSIDPDRLRLTGDNTQGVLLGQRCRDCGVYMFGTALCCQGCTSSSLETVELSQHGTLYSYTVVRVPPEGWPGPVPYVLGQVELAEGPHVLAEVIDCPPHSIRIGMSVELAVQRVTLGGLDEERTAYRWRPARKSDKSR